MIKEIESSISAPVLNIEFIKTCCEKMLIFPVSINIKSIIIFVMGHFCNSQPAKLVYNLMSIIE